MIIDAFDDEHVYGWLKPDPDVRYMASFKDIPFETFLELTANLLVEVDLDTVSNIWTPIELEMEVDC
jgi:hypothetical protein